MKTIYAAGAIGGQTQETASQWREQFKLLIDPVKVLSPMRGTDHLKGKGTLSVFEYAEDFMTTQAAIIARDRFDVMNCDLVVMNLLGLKVVSKGSMIEVGWADAFRKPIVAIMEPGNVHEHAMVNGMISWRVSTLEDAAYVVRSVLAV